MEHTRGIGIEATISDGVNCNLTIENCAFHRNKDGHLLLTSKSTAVINLKIVNSSFVVSNSFGVAIESRGIVNKMTVISHNSTFDDNELAGLVVINAVYTEITGCSFANSGGDGVWIDDVNSVRIKNCSVYNNRGTGVSIYFSNYRA